MKRHPTLQQLSREHHLALKLARHARLAAASGQPAAVQDLSRQATTLFVTELEPHFQREEQDLLKNLSAAGEQALTARTLAEHQALRELVSRLAEPDSDTLMTFASLLEAHVRFEERELFETAQALLIRPAGE